MSSGDARSISDYSRMTQDYLQAIWKASEWSNEPITTNELSTRLGVTVSTVSSGIKRLQADGLVRHERYGAIELTDHGRAAAVQMVRRHRLLETYLVQCLGYSWDEVHEEAEHLEHAVSDLLVERIDARLGRPERDPHGDPIPSSVGVIARLDATRLADLPEGGCGRVVRVSDEHPELLRFLSDHRLDIGSHVRMNARRDFAGLVSIGHIGTAESDEVPVELGITAAEAIWVSPDEHAREGLRPGAAPQRDGADR